MVFGINNTSDLLKETTEQKIAELKAGGKIKIKFSGQYKNDNKVFPIETMKPKYDLTLRLDVNSSLL